MSKSKQPPSVICFDLDHVAIYEGPMEVNAHESVDCFIMEVCLMDDEPVFFWGMTRTAAAELLPYLQDFIARGQP